MDYIADLHVHSPFSRATSKQSNPGGLFAWARIKGIQVIGTGDFTHPGWLARLKEDLEPAEPGFLRLKNEHVPSPLPGIPVGDATVRFVLSSEISCIYKRNSAVRKVHNLVYVPDFAAAERISIRLAGIGNIESDGRPILGLDSRNLLEIVLEEAPEGFLVPAHIWTPWFSLFGSRSGFDTVEECFGDLSSHVFALETGLSSDPDMNRMISALDRFALISNSDCHSPAKLGREANLFSTGFDFFSLRAALRDNNRETFRGTIEFFPEEGKYHLDGHRACAVRFDPEETRRLDGRCPVCGKHLTVGVLHRVMELADRKNPYFPDDSPGFFSLVPLPELLGEIAGVGPASKDVLHRYGRLIDRFGSEFGLLLRASTEEIAQESPLLAEAVTRIREGQVIRVGGYDGEFGTIRVFEEGEISRLTGQAGLFSTVSPVKTGKKARCPLKLTATDPAPPSHAPDNRPVRSSSGPNPEQSEAIRSDDRRLLVDAGPGTGKTYTLTARIVSLLAAGTALPDRICAITFTNRAAEEMRERLTRAVGGSLGGMFIGTFHRFCLDRLRLVASDLEVIGPESRDRILKRLFPGAGAQEHDVTKQEIEAFYRGPETAAPSERVTRYEDELVRLSAIDLDGVVPLVLRRLEEDHLFREQVRGRIEHLFVDEFQDLNPPQFRLVEFLAERASIFAIGDPDQAIYGFRGSDPSFFHHFARASGTRTIALVRNYRSATRIIEAASAVITGNRRPGALSLVPTVETGGRIELHRMPSPAAEAEFVVKRIEELMSGISSFSLASGRGGEHGPGRGFGDIAVLYRLSRQADELAAALQRRGIPFQLVGSTPYFLSPGVRAVTRFIWCAADSRETADWLALLRELPGIGDATVERLEASLPITGNFLALKRVVDLPATAARQLDCLAQNLTRFRDTINTVGLAAAIIHALPLLAVERENPDCVRLLSLAACFGSDLWAFSRHLRAYANETIYDRRAEAVALMTLHAAKGLEFPVVFITGCEEGILPCAMWRKADVEEERRLFYVGLTRTEETLILSSSATRQWAGPGERAQSRFVTEIPENLITRISSARRARKAEQMELF